MMDVPAGTSIEVLWGKNVILCVIVENANPAARQMAKGREHGA
jgi:hypothetical protein